MQVLERRGQVGSPTAPSPETTTCGTQRSLGAGSASPRPHPGGSGTHGPSDLDGEGRLWRPGPMLRNPAPPPSRPRPPGGLCRRFQPLLTWGPRAGRGWGARAPGGEDRRGQGKPPAWRARGAPPLGRTQQAEAQEQGPATRAGLGAPRGLGAAVWGWTWVTCGRQGPKDNEGREMSGSAPP